MHTAYYAQNFSSYEIRPTSISGFFSISSDSQTDLVNFDTTNFVFKDCTKSYNELFGDFAQIFKFGKEIGCDKDVELIKILIQGYDENSDSLVFDSLALSSPYRYSIANKAIEVSFNFSKDDDVSKFLSSLTYRYTFGDTDEVRRIFVYINGELSYDKILKSQERMI
ncbi:DUF5416 family protein [Campylobacter mucosalis]|uniref:DUF5416 family protein n=1 Tax=Campylobacter mucosalis TaxID=202 RepID=UPI0014702FF3|nr:DUF5416 family protein [Campylobacter mucosalis]